VSKQTLRQHSCVEEILDDTIFLSGADALVNPVNCRGVSGAGLALEFRKRFPEQQKAYEKHCRQGLMKPGDVLVVPPAGLDPFILYFATKDHWKDPPRYEWIETGLNKTAETCVQLNITSLALPALGCGLGGLDWFRVRDLVYRAFDRIVGMRVLLYVPRKVGTYNVSTMEVPE